MSGLFVTSTGTGIGKTLVATLLIGRLREQGRAVAALKPVITGFDPADAAASDTGLLLAALGRAVTADSVAAISPWRFAAPLSPDMAASREGATLSAAAIAAFCRDADRPGQVTLAEGIGGAMVPLGGRETLLDAMAALGWPVVLVTGSYLGTLSHTLTAARALAGAGVNLAGVVISESPESPVPPAETAAALSRYVTSVPVIVLPRLPASPGPKRDAPDLSVLAPPV